VTGAVLSFLRVAQPNETMRRSQTAPIKVALVQMQCGSDPAANREKAIAFVRDEATQCAQVMMTTG
jgi:hypothetical protein